jgi:hypothetical protein
MKPRFQFRIANLLLATFWTAAWFGAYAALKHVLYLEMELGPDSQWPKRQVLTFLLAVIPFSAIGALFGKTWRETLIGSALMLSVALLYWLFNPVIG